MGSELVRRSVSRLKANFRSMPNIICDDFFSNLTQSLTDLYPNSLKSADAQSVGATTATEPRKVRQVRVFCRLRELDPNTGRNLIKRQLTRVREEEDDNQDDYQNPGQWIGADMRKLDLKLSNVTPKLSRRSMSSNSLDQDWDFGSFLSGQRATRHKPTASRIGSRSHELSCCELFVVHDANLLVSKSQLTVEAQLLGRRLARLIASCQQY